MDFVDRMLDQIQRDVETHGKSGGETVFLTNLSFTVPPEEFTTPSDADVEGCICDVSWFFKCAREKRVVECGNPDTSFFIKFFGTNARPYGDTWDLPLLKQRLLNIDSRQAILFNHDGPEGSACVSCYQFQCVDYGVLDCIVTMRSSDVANVLAQDVFMSQLILEEISQMSGYAPGSLTFNIGNAHIYYKDLQNPEEFVIDYGG